MLNVHPSEGLACAEEAMGSLAQDRTLGTELLGYNPYTMLADIGAGMLGVASADCGGVYSWLDDPQVGRRAAR
jgi:hypothetical protein